MSVGVAVNIVFGFVVMTSGIGLGWLLRQRGVTANNLFRGKAPLSLVGLGSCVCAVIVISHLPQLPFAPLAWKAAGIQMSWLLLRSLLLGVCGVAIAISWQVAQRQLFATVLICGVGFLTLLGIEQYLLTPIYPSLTHHVGPQGIVRQTSESSCAPAALATVLHQWQINTSEPEVAKLAGTSRAGTSMPQLISAAQELGMDGLTLQPTWDTIRQINRPGILSIWLRDGDRRLPHAVALLKMNQDTAVIADPAEGKAFMVDRSALEAVWRQEYIPIFRPQDIELSPPEAQRYLLALGYDFRDFASSPLSWMPYAPKRWHRALRQFQADNPGLRQSGALDVATVLALTGAFAHQTPTLELAERLERTTMDYHQPGV
ncbi:MAG: cysteine peptidase family C39 domain-containing protein [Leptolyngbyaceae cyanobacterium]